MVHVTCPTGGDLADDEAVGMALMEAESRCPFPQEQMVSSARLSGGRDWAEAWVAVRSNLNDFQGGAEDILAWPHLPGGLIASALSEQEGGAIIVEIGPERVLAWSDDEGRPYQLAWKVMPEENSDEDEGGLVTDLSELLGYGKPPYLEAGRFQLELDESGRVVTPELRRVSDGQSLPLDLPASDLRVGDLRDDEEKQLAEKAGRAEHRVTVVLASAGIAAVMIGILYLWMQWLEHRVTRGDERIEALSESVEQVDAQYAVLATLRNSIAGTSNPFLLLEKINLIRPESVYLTQFDYTNSDTVLLEGRASTVGALNDFADNLREVEEVRSVDATVSSRAGAVLFEITVTFTQNEA